MAENILTLIIAVVSLLISMVTFLLLKTRKEIKDPVDTFSAKPLQLQAYERIAMLAERIAIPNLVSRANMSNPGISTRDMHLLLLESIKQEYEYNSSQQIYVTVIAWEAVKNLKDQNMLIINQVASTLPPDASGHDLNRRLLEFMMTQPKGQLHNIVLEAINFEAKRLMK